MTTELVGAPPSSEQILVDGIPLDQYITRKVDERIAEISRVAQLSTSEVAFKIAGFLRRRNDVGNPLSGQARPVE